MRYCWNGVETLLIRKTIEMCLNSLCLIQIWRSWALVSTVVWDFQVGWGSFHSLTVGKEWGLQKLACLSRLEIEGRCKNVVSFLKENLLPDSLKSLRISRLLNLKNLNYKGLQHLTGLKTLEIRCFNKLWSLLEEGLPSSLSFLCIKGCSLLKSKLQNKTGNDWSNIAHIS